MRTVTDSRNVYYLWANAVQPHARNKTGTVSFDGPFAFSYRAVIGKRVTNRRGQIGYYVNTHRYSVTTSKHQNFLWWAVPATWTSGRVFWFDFMGGTESPRALVKQYVERIAALRAQARRARERRMDLLAQAQDLVTEMDAFVRFWSLRVLGVPARERAALAAEREAARVYVAGLPERRRRVTIMRWHMPKEAQAKADRWKAGEDVGLDGWAYRVPMALRIVGDVVETSHGTDVSLAVARRVWERYRAGLPIHGEVLDGYTVTAAGPDVIRIGCHEIPVAEAARVLGEGVPHAAA